MIDYKTIGMGERTVNWLVYTCLVGLIPVIARLALWAVSRSDVEPLAISDLVAFGLVLHSANINEVSRLKVADPRWTSVQNGLSIIFLILYGLILFTTILPSDKLDSSALLKSTIGMAVVSFLLSLTVLHRIWSEEG